MDRQGVFEWVREEYGTEPDYPWSDDNAVLRHKGNRKWYGVVLRVGKEKLGIKGYGVADILNVKCEPILIGSLLTRPGFYKAYHMNKNKWISILLDEEGSEEEIKNLIAMSYELTETKKRKHSKEQM